MTKHIRFTKEDRNLFLICVFAGVFVFFAKIVNELPNPDAIWQGMAYKDGWGWEGGLGRYMIGFLQKVRSNVISTEFISLTSILFLAAICVCVVNIFEVTDDISRLLIAGLIILSPTVGSTLTYYYCSDMYFLSYLLVVGAVLFAVKYQSVVGWGICVIGICLSASIYQAYLGIAITLCFLVLWYMLLDEKYCMRDILLQSVRLLTGGCVGIVLYLISNQVIQRWFGIQAVADRGFASMGQISFGELPKLIQVVYRGFYEYFLSSTMINNFGGGRRHDINGLFGLCALLLLIITLCRKKMPLYRKALMFFGILLLPIPIMSIVIMAPEVSIYDSTGVLMLPTMNYVYIAFVVLYFKQKCSFGVKEQKVLKIVLTSCSVLVCYMLLILELSGQAYMKHHMNKTQAVAFMMVDEIEEIVDYSENYKICIIGTMENGNYPEIYEALEIGTQWTTAHHKTMWTSFSGIQNGWINYISHYMGKKYDACSQADYDMILQSKEYADMQNFPDERSIIVVDNIIVVKLSDV